MEIIEETDPDLALLFYDVVNKKFKYNVRRILQVENTLVLIPYKVYERNDRCFCGSGKKYKKCTCRFLFED